MKEKELEVCADLIEFISNKLLELTQSESEMLKIVKIGVSRVINKPRRYGKTKEKTI